MLSPILRGQRVRATLVLSLSLLLFATGCQTLNQIANLRNVDFSLDRVGQANLAGIRLDQVRDYRDLSATDILRVGAALTTGKLPMEFVLHLGAENPAENSVDARMVRMDWTLFLDDRETISGVFDDNILLPSGQVSDIPIPIRLDLLAFFNGGAQDLIELALAVTGQNGQPKRIKIRATPTIDTPIGPIRYPNPITIVSKDVGS